MDRTPKLNLNIPRGNDYVDIDVLGQNFEIIDEKLGENIERTNENLHQINTLSDRVTTIESELSDQQELTTTLKYGSQVIKVPRDTPFNVLSLKGCTLINLLGKIGNFEKDSNSDGLADGFTAFNGALKTVVNDGKYGSYAQRIESTPSDLYVPRGITTAFLPLAQNKCYLLAVDVKGDGVSKGRLYTDNPSQTRSYTKAFTPSINYRLQYLKFKPDIADTFRFIVYNYNDVGAVGWVQYDGLRLYEIPQSIYDLIDVDPEYTGDKLAEKFPYVDSVQAIQNPYVIRRSRNLLPPFTQWVLHANTKVKSLYEVEHISTAQFQNNTVNVSVLENQSYTISRQGNGYMLVKAYDKNGSFISDCVAATEAISATFTTPSNVSYITIFFIPYTLSLGTFTFTNPMLNIGSTALPFEPFEEDYLFLEAKLHSSMDLTVYDELIPTDTGFEKLGRFREVVLDGGLSYLFQSDHTGFKRIYISYTEWNIDKNIPVSMVKYDGKVLASGLDDGQTKEMSDAVALYGSVDKLIISIADIDSGWGETYTPTPQEIQAYFNGWKMNNGTFGTPYNGTGTKTWVPWSATSNTGAVTTVPTTPSSDIMNKVFDFYKLVYQLTSPVREPVKYEGAISLKEGQNIVDLGSGVAVRERCTPNINVTTGLYQINTTENPLKYRNDKIISVYKDGLPDNIAKIGRRVPESVHIKTIGWEFAEISPAFFDPTAIYEVTYLVLDKHLFTTNPIDLSGSYEAYLNEVVGKIVEKQSNLETKVSVIENTYARKERMPWITPTLLNGWTTHKTVGYSKDEMGFVHIKGMVKDGLTTPYYALFYLPTGYRPAQESYFTTYTDSGTIGSGTVQPLKIHPDGRVEIILNAAKTYIALDGLVFRAEK
jgi:hypothetical protein